MPLSENRVLVVLVLNAQEVQNRIIQTRRPYNTVELQQAAHYLNDQFAGKSIKQVRESLLRELRETRDSLDRLMQTVVEMAEQTFETEPASEDYVVAGQTHLMQYADLSDLDRLRQLFEAFNHKRDLLDLFDQCLHAEGVQIFIGEESGFGALEGYSVVTAPYTVEGQVLGVLGSSVRPEWLTTGSFRWWMSPLGCWRRRLTNKTSMANPDPAFPLLY